jgi:hypothetical protein
MSGDRRPVPRLHGDGAAYDRAERTDHTMTTPPDAEPPNPSLGDQVSRLDDLIAGYHLTNLIEGRLVAEKPS